MNSAIRPSIGHPKFSERRDTALGRSFAITFGPGQQLPTHTNPSRIVISVVRGSGNLALSTEQRRQLAAGDVVQLEPREPHGIAAGTDGLELEVTMVQNCCGAC
ncbi:MAG: cupin domain-containing protein [Gemmatimonadales bacterium]|nr:cupin domain-containing protein [Gemmatimonadales bacterium]